MAPLPDSTILVTTHRRGSSVRLNISVLRINKTKAEYIYSEPIEVSDWGRLVIKCKQSSSTTNYDVELSVRMIKNENTRKCTVQVTCEKFSKSMSLSEEWVETKILTKGTADEYVSDPHYIPSSDNSKYALLYTTVVNITVLEETPMAIFVNKQLYEDVDSIDFQLQTADGSVDVHKAVLFIHSEMFRTMFRGEWKETGEGRIKLDGVTAQTLQHLKDYMYLGTLPDEDEGLESMLLFASCYMMDNLKKVCITKLVKTIKPENFDDVVEFAVQNNIYDLVNALIMETPDDVLHKVHELKTNTNKNDEK